MSDDHKLITFPGQPWKKSKPKVRGIATKSDQKGEMFARVSDLIEWVEAGPATISREQMLTELRALDFKPPGTA